AAVGQSPSGHLILTNLEELGCVRLTGDDTAAKALARSITAELTLSPWSVLADIDTIGIADELGDLDPLRLHHHTSDDTAFLTHLAEELAQQGDREPETFHAVVAVSAAESTDLAHSFTAHPHRLGAALVTVGGHEREHDVVFHLSDDGRLLIDDLNLNLSPAGLTAAEATATAALVSATRDAVTVPSPRNRTSEPAWRATTDRSGALSMTYADAMPGSDDTLTVNEPDSLPTVETAEEVDDPAPVPAMSITEPLDPDLDADVKAWFDEDCRLPRLHLLGPVRAQAHGDPAAVYRRKPHYVEMLTFLTLHPEGLTTKQIAEAFSINKDRVRVDVGVVRKWLGQNERTGHPHLPPAAQSRAADEAGVWTYQVDDVLVDADLFRRLRARGQSRGVEGQDDFDTALLLVEGAPFSDLRETGWSWLLDADCRDDEILACAIVDVAHDVVTAALEDGALDRALNAVETARLAAPYDEVARVDLAAVLVAQGHEDAARAFLTEAVHNRSDDQLGPIDLPARTAELLRRNHTNR
ncbi:MAG: bacterial transcriptional activator domain-containing protein, partial [Nocardioides sp.]|nr:bacterial transcriptional activator domain-containing protein [Nocardioides sp.]